MSEQVKTFQTMSDYFKQWKVAPLLMVEGINQENAFNPLLPRYFPSSYLPGPRDDLDYDPDNEPVPPPLPPKNVPVPPPLPE